MANINGKMIPQVKGTMLYIGKGEVRTFNIVRDGTSSISSFSADILNDDEATIPVADISLLLGALTKHASGLITLSHADDKLRIQSDKKQTTLQSSETAQAFSHTKKTIAEWCEDSKMRYEHTIEKNLNGYTLKNGDVVPEAFKIIIDADHLCSAISSGSMNGQKVENYSFFTKEQSSFNCLMLSVGADGKGKTETRLHTNAEGTLEPATIAGGLDNVLRTVNGEVILSFFDLTPHGGGMSLRLSFEGGCVFQRESVHATN